MHMHTHMHVHVNMHVHMPMHMSICACTYACVRARARACACECGYFAQGFVGLIEWMLTVDPRKRPPVQDVIARVQVVRGSQPHAHPQSGCARHPRYGPDTAQMRLPSPVHAPRRRAP